MPISFDDKPLEEAIEAMAARQDVPTSKRAMVWAILRDAVEAVRRSDDPRAWRASVHVTSSSPGPGKPGPPLPGP